MQIKNRSWMKLEKIYKENNYKEKQEDIVCAIDCGWIEQIIPFIKQFSSEEDMILDPFCGLGTTIVGAVLENRRGLGVEIEESRVKLAENRLSKIGGKFRIIHGSAVKLDIENRNVNMVITNLPYFGFENFKGKKNDNQVYSKNDYDDYLKFIRKSIKEINRVLKKDCYAVFFIENKRQENGNLVPLAWDVGKIIQEEMVLKEERTLLYEKESQVLSDPAITNRSHEYALVALKKIELLDLSYGYDTLRKINTNKCPYMIIGTVGISYLMPEVLDNPPEDIDILIKNNKAAISYIMDLMLKNGYRIYSWQDEVTKAEYSEKFSGRYYLRAVGKWGIIIDITYECEYLNFHDSWEKSIEKEGLKIACQEDILALMEARGNRKDKILIERVTKYGDKKNNS